METTHGHFTPERGAERSYPEEATVDFSGEWR